MFMTFQRFSVKIITVPILFVQGVVISWQMITKTETINLLRWRWSIPSQDDYYSFFDEFLKIRRFIDWHIKTILNSNFSFYEMLFDCFFIKKTLIFTKKESEIKLKKPIFMNSFESGFLKIDIDAVGTSYF